MSVALLIQENREAFALEKKQGERTGEKNLGEYRWPGAP